MKPPMYPMDADALTASTHGVVEAAAVMLDLAGWDPQAAAELFDDASEKLANALVDLLQWRPDLDEDSNQLLGALLKWLP